MKRNPGYSSEQLQGIRMACGRITTGNPNYFPQSTLRGRKLFFCTQFCLDAFHSDPQLFLRMHRRSGNQTGARRKSHAS